jgi:hypothetical protein
MVLYYFKLIFKDKEKKYQQINDKSYTILGANNIPHCPFRDVLDLHFLLPKFTKIVHVSVKIFGEWEAFIDKKCISDLPYEHSDVKPILHLCAKHDKYPKTTRNEKKTWDN